MSAAGGSKIGIMTAKYGFDCDTCGIITNIDEQSTDIALGVDQGDSDEGEGATAIRA